MAGSTGIDDRTKWSANMFRLMTAFAVCLVVSLCGLLTIAGAQGSSPPNEKATGRNPAKPSSSDESAPAKDKLVPLNKSGTVLLDVPGKRVLLKAEVVLQEGLLEMLCCLKQTKEHESILAVDAKAYVVHTGLLAIGATPGAPVRFTPEYKPPTGQKIKIHLQWTDKKGVLQRVPAQSWVRHATRRFFAADLERLPEGLTIPKDSELRYDERAKELLWFGPMSKEQRDKLLELSKDDEYRAAVKTFYKRSQPREMQADWVFAGSGFYVDETTGERLYQAEGGDLICVANFPTATIDVAIKSSASGEANLLYEAYTERIPPRGTNVTIELIPVFEKEPKKPPNAKR